MSEEIDHCNDVLRCAAGAFSGSLVAAVAEGCAVQVKALRNANLEKQTFSSSSKKLVVVVEANLLSRSISVSKTLPIPTSIQQQKKCQQQIKAVAVKRLLPVKHCRSEPVKQIVAKSSPVLFLTKCSSQTLYHLKCTPLHLTAVTKVYVILVMRKR